MTEQTENKADNGSADWLWLVLGTVVLVGGFVAVRYIF